MTTAVYYSFIYSRRNPLVTLTTELPLSLRNKKKRGKNFLWKLVIVCVIFVSRILFLFTRTAKNKIEFKVVVLCATARWHYKSQHKKICCFRNNFEIKPEWPWKFRYFPHPFDTISLIFLFFIMKNGYNFIRHRLVKPLQHFPVQIHRKTEKWTLCNSIFCTKIIILNFYILIS